MSRLDAMVFFRAAGIKSFQEDLDLIISYITYYIYIYVCVYVYIYIYTYTLYMYTYHV